MICLCNGKCKTCLGKLIRPEINFSPFPLGPVSIQTWQVPEYILITLKEEISLPLDILYMIEDVLWWDEKYRAKKLWVDREIWVLSREYAMLNCYPTVADMNRWYQQQIKDRR